MSDLDKAGGKARKHVKQTAKPASGFSSNTMLVVTDALKIF